MPRSKTPNRNGAKPDNCHGRFHSEKDSPTNPDPSICFWNVFDDPATKKTKLCKKILIQNCQVFGNMTYW